MEHGDELYTIISEHCTKLLKRSLAGEELFRALKSIEMNIFIRQDVDAALIENEVQSRP